MPDTLIHVVRQGEFILGIAQKYGVAPDDIWGHPKNKSLADGRRTMTVLAPGDVLTVPKVEPKWLPITVGSNNKFVATPPTVTVSVKAQDPNGKAIANEAWVAPDLALSGTTDGDGLLEVKAVPLGTAQVQVQLTRLGVVLMLNVGHLDPVSTPRGCAQRLAHLGFLPCSGMRATAEATDWALESFRLSSAPQATAPSDVLDALVASHGA